MVCGVGGMGGTDVEPLSVERGRGTGRGDRRPLELAPAADDLVEEVDVLAINAGESAKWIQEWKNTYDAIPADKEGEVA